MTQHFVSHAEPSQASTIQVGRLRYAFELSVSDAEKMLDAVSGTYSTGAAFSHYFNSHAGAAYNSKKTKPMLNSLTQADCLFGRSILDPASEGQPTAQVVYQLLDGFGSLVHEARALSGDSNSNAAHPFSGLDTSRELVRRAIIDLCSVPFFPAVLYVAGILGRKLKRQLKELTHEFVDQMLNGAVPADYCLQYSNVIAERGKDTPSGKKVRAYLYRVQGVMSNKQITDAVGYEFGNITRYAHEGREIAVNTWGLPCLDKYLSPGKVNRSHPKAEKYSFSG